MEKLVFLSPYGFDVQLIGQIPEPILAEIVGWLAVVAGLATCAAMLTLSRARPNRRSPIVLPLPASELESGTDWQKVMDVSLMELVRAPDLHAMHGDAATQVDAAEHALNRLLAECSKATSLVMAPTFEPLRQLVREPAASPAQRPPLAA